MKNKTILLLALLSFSLFFNNRFNYASAQVSDSAKKWHFITDVYLIFPYMNGEAGVGNIVTVPVDANPGDIFSKLMIAGMFYFEANTARWAITTDFVYMNLNQEVTPGTLIHSGEVGAEQFVWETAFLYRLAPFLELGAGGRFNNLQTDIDIRRNVFPAGTLEVTGSASKTWIDPIIIARLSADIKDKWLFQLRGDVGGFGMGSDFTWQLQAFAGYRFSRVFQVSAGYRILSIDYDKGSDSDRFIYNVDTFGPEIKFGFNF
jgi:hypothetical protein